MDKIYKTHSTHPKDSKRQVAEAMKDYNSSPNYYTAKRVRLKGNWGSLMTLILGALIYSLFFPIIRGMVSEQSLIEHCFLMLKVLPMLQPKIAFICS